MSEEDKKLHIFTSLNTKINRDNTEDSDYYVNECNYIIISKFTKNSMVKIINTLRRREKEQVKRNEK
jgi:hypothetical protein